MSQAKLLAEKTSGFALKDRHIELIRHGGRSEHTTMSVVDLEVLRTDRTAVPASKHGLEAICGASCETGAI
jgi:hypothetical protein